MPPINCKTPKSVNNIPDVSQIGDEIFGGIITIVTESGAEVTINGNPIAAYGAIPQTVLANPIYESYTIEGLIGNVSIESTAQVYVATFGAYEYATFGGYYSGFEFRPEIILETLTNEEQSCIPNLNLSLSSISSYDQYQWFYNGEEINGANSNSYTPDTPGYYQISGVIDNCDGSLLSNNIPVSACPNDYDGDGVNDNIDIDNDNDGLLDCFESNGDQDLNILESGGNIENIGNYDFSIDESPNSVNPDNWSSFDGGFSILTDPNYIDENAEEQAGYTKTNITFENEVSLEFYYDIPEGINLSMDNPLLYNLYFHYHSYLY